MIISNGANNSKVTHIQGLFIFVVCLFVITPGYVTPALATVLQVQAMDIVMFLCTLSRSVG